VRQRAIIASVIFGLAAWAALIAFVLALVEFFA